MIISQQNRHSCNLRPCIHCLPTVHAIYVRAFTAFPQR